jgi:hypothetical protein
MRQQAPVDQSTDVTVPDAFITDLDAEEAWHIREECSQALRDFAIARANSPKKLFNLHQISVCRIERRSNDLTF